MYVYGIGNNDTDAINEISNDASKKFMLMKNLINDFLK
jgi:hypothetical protein